jgi:hypothetical protein
MACRLRIVALTGLGLLASACAQKSETTLPALDASATRDARALVVQSVYSEGFSAPTDIVRGAGEGATAGMSDYLDGLSGTYSGEGAVIVLLLTPVILPIAAAVGASTAHSEEEVSAAVATFESVGHDEALLTSLDRRFVERLGGDGAGWSCVEAMSAAAGTPCPGMSPVARLSIYPVFTISGVGKYNPEIRFFGEVTARLSVAGAAPDAPERQVLEAKWAYREDLGTFFDLAKDDGALLRARLEGILDRVAAGIVRDLYRDPQPQVIVRTREFLADGGTTELPEGKLVRIEEGVKE